MTWTQDAVSWLAVWVPHSGSPVIIDSVETWSTTKRDNGDAGTFSFSCPLQAVKDTVAQFAAPNDLVAIFAARSSVGPGLTVPSTQALTQIPTLARSWKWGDIATITAMGSLPTCVMIGLVDQHEEDRDPDAASASFHVTGRDLTKILVDNDVTVPFNIPAGGLDGGVFNLLSNVLLNRQDSGVQMLLRVLDIFVTKDPQAIRNLEGPQQPAPGAGPDPLDSIAPYGFKWRNFIRTDDKVLLNPDFLNLPKDLPSLLYSVQQGSAWANVADLRNYPLARCFIDEIGRLVMDDTYSAWGYGPQPKDVVGAIGPTVLRHPRYSRADSDYITGLTIVPGLTAFATSDVGQNFQIGHTSTIGDPGVTVARYGWRYAQFTSLYDPPTIDPEVLKRTRGPVLLALHNDAWRATLVVKGDPRYKVGQRFAVADNPAHQELQPAPGSVKAWYLESVEHSATFGVDYSTILTCRFPRDYALPALAGVPTPTAITGGFT